MTDAREAAERIVAAADVPSLADGPVDTPERHDQLQAWCAAERYLDSWEVHVALIEIARAYLALLSPSEEDVRRVAKALSLKATTEGMGGPLAEWYAHALARAAIAALTKRG